MIEVKQYGDWIRARRSISAAAALRMNRAWRKAMLKEAHIWRKALVTGMTRQMPGGKKYTKLKQLTWAKRRAEGFSGRKALLRTGAFRRNINVTERGKTIFVGVLRGVRTRDGKEMVNIFRVHEEGRIIVMRVTPAMRNYFYAMIRRSGIQLHGKKGTGGFKRGILIIKIPARPTFAPVYEHMLRNKGSMRRRIMRAFSIASKGEFGLVW